jgi:hypothetical protein
VSYQSIKIYQKALESFIKDRPREWVALLAFRSTEVAVDKGYVEYIAFAQHRESWQNIGACLDSRAELASFGLELSKTMGIRYHSPPMPVDLSMNPGGQEFNLMRDMQRSVDVETGSHASHPYDLGAVAAMFNRDKKY